MKKETHIRRCLLGYVRQIEMPTSNSWAETFDEIKKDCLHSIEMTKRWIAKIEKKLANPVNERTGKPLKDTTIRQKQANLKRRCGDLTSENEVLRLIGSSRDIGDLYGLMCMKLNREPLLTFDGKTYSLNGENSQEEPAPDPNKKITITYHDIKTGKLANFIKESSPGEKIHSPNDIFHLIKPLTLEEPDREYFYGAFLNNANTVLSIDILFKGTINQAAVYPREIIKRMLQLGATSLIIAHNHPSGKATPSKQDISLTKKVSASVSAIDGTLLDHVIIGDRGYYSFKENNHLNT